MDNGNEEIGWSFRFTVAIGVAILLVSAIGAIGYWVIYPAILDQQTEANRNSVQYVSTTQNVLRDSMEDYLELDVKIAELSQDPANQDIVDGMRAQQLAILSEMRGKADTLDPDQVPPEVAEFLANHPR